MKKTILIGLMVMLFAMPCLGQTDIEQIEPEGLFSLNNSIWMEVFFGNSYLRNYGFADNKIYQCSPRLDGGGYCSLASDSFILDLGAISIFTYNPPLQTYFGIASPILGLGIVNSCQIIFGFNICLPSNLIKLADNWTPPETD